MKWLIRNALPIGFFTVALLIHYLVPMEWGDRDGLVLVVALLGTMILLSDLIVMSLGRVFSAYSHIWCFFIAPGTILHEIGHYVACKLTFVEVTEFQPFKPNPDTGQLGYVAFRLKHSSANLSVIKGLIVAMAPFFSGALALTGLLYVIAPNLQLPNLELRDLSALHNELLEFYEALRAGILDDARLGYWKYLVIYVILVIGSGAAPSTTDFTIPFKQGSKRWVAGLMALLFLGALSAAALMLPVLGRKLVSVLALAAACQFVSLSCVVVIRLVVSGLGALRPKKARSSG